MQDEQVTHAKDELRQMTKKPTRATIGAVTISSLVAKYLKNFERRHWHVVCEERQHYVDDGPQRKHGVSIAPGKHKLKGICEQ